MSKGDTTLDKVLELALHGFGVAWNPMYKEFRAFQVEDGETIAWWNHECFGIEFDEAIDKLYKIWDEEIKS